SASILPFINILFVVCFPLEPTTLRLLNSGPQKSDARIAGACVNLVKTLESADDRSEQPLNTDFRSAITYRSRANRTMSRLFLCFLFGAALASLAEIAPPRRRRSSEPSTVSSNNLLVEVSERALRAGIDRFGIWLAAQLYDVGQLPDFESSQRILKIKAYNIWLTSVNLGDFALKIDDRLGSASLEFPNVSLVIQGEWNGTPMRARDRGNLTVYVNNTRLELIHMVPKTFSGIPFIDRDVYCHATIEPLTLDFGDREGSMKWYNFALPRMEQDFRDGTHKMLCEEAVNILDEYLRYGAMHLSLQHLIYGRHLLNYSTVADPQFVGTSLILQHSGQIDEQAVKAQVDEHQRFDGDWMVKYSIHPDLINQMLVVLADASAFDKNLTIRNAENLQIHLALTTFQPPNITISEHSATLNIVSQWDVRMDESDEINLLTAYSEDFGLEAKFDNSAQLRFKLAVKQFNRDEANDSKEKDRATDSRSLFTNAVHRHYSAVIARFLRLPLPKYQNTTVTAGHVAFANGFLQFGADFASDEDATVNT
uniref:Uncharacterized protein n=1 Tax=Plectus sambesii TaxID=2011161 RepID=A0A914W7V7_9BILA